MAPGRRNHDRRRRVLYTAHHAESAPSTAASRRAAERLREARRPTAAYGLRVQRRLRGKWFSLVPVRRRTLTAVATALLGLSLLLCAAHYASVAWPAVAQHEEIARPLRLDRADSFGRWITCVLLAGSAGVSLLIYQLRRYRIDDYQGHYRLWRLVLVVMLLASVNSLVSIIDFGGAILDAGFGRRVALSGSDWIRLVVSLGGAILALRLVAEVRSSRWALANMLATCALLIIPEAAKWNVLKVESLGVWFLVTSAPLLAFTTLFLSLGGYLRMLYREVRQIEDSETFAQRMQKLRLRVFQWSEEDDGDRQADDHQDDVNAEQPKERWKKRKRQEATEPEYQNKRDKRRRVDTEDENSEQASQPQRRWWQRKSKPAGKGHLSEADSAEVKDDDPAGQAEENEEDQPARRRRWLGRRGRQTQNAQDQDAEVQSEDEASPVDDESPKRRSKKKRRFSLRLDPATRIQAQENSQSDETEEPPAAEASKKRGVGGWFGRKKAASETDDSLDDNVSSTDVEDSPQPNSPSSTSDEDDVDPDDIDWSSLSKSERRRLRKKLRRQGRAA
ncbi:MAG: hypothetical protein MI861_06500 [Pirellulales bacterium]|nr:hypothetical protein [Pirellulales bacterium]